MKRYTGKGVVKGIAIGKIYLYKKQNYKVVRTEVSDVNAERERFESAVETSKDQLAILYEDALKNLGEDHAAIFEIHKMILADDNYLDAVKNVIEKGFSVEYAVSVAEEQFAEMLASTDDEYLKARAADIRDISRRVLNILEGNGEDSIHTDGPVIVVAEDLTPSETVKMDKDKILAFVTVKGSPNSHTAILARGMNLPSLVNTQMELKEEMNGKMAVVDGFNGEFIIEQ